MTAREASDGREHSSHGEHDGRAGRAERGGRAEHGEHGKHGGRAEHGVIALGANLGDRESTLAHAVRELAETDGIEVTGISRLIESVALKPEGLDADAPAYLNGVVTITTTLDPHTLLDRLNEIELRHGRTREERWGDRTLDLDVVDLGGRQQHDERLTLPHPRAHERDFVLRPWAQLQPDAVLVGHGRVDALLAALDSAAASALRSGPTRDAS